MDAPDLDREWKGGSREGGVGALQRQTRRRIEYQKPFLYCLIRCYFIL